MQIEILIRSFLDGAYDERLLDIYADETKISYQRERYINAIKKFEQCYKPGDVELFSAPGRSEIGGNHTDHQNGEVLAASVNLDTIGIVKKTDDNVIRLVSDNYDEIIIRLDDVSVKEKEKETTKALIKGVVSGFLERKYAVGGFQAYITSDVLIGAGLSSSAAFETLIGTILSGLYNCGKVSATEIAIIGQYAENVYFGKPCGLMDQMASSTGNLVHIDFANPENPQVEKIDFDMEKYGYRLCITDTKGSHADLTDEYAAVPKEMKLVAKYFGKKVLRDVSANDVLENIHNLREASPPAWNRPKRTWRARRSRCRTSRPARSATCAAAPWSSRWASTASSWRAAASRSAGAPSVSSRTPAASAPSAARAVCWSARAPRAASTTAASATPTAIS